MSDAIPWFDPSPSRFGASLAVAACLVASGCDQPVEPGSDLPDDAPPAVLGPEIDTGGFGDVAAEAGTDVTGEFRVESEMTTSSAPRPIPVAIEADLEQSGEIQSGEATLTMMLTPPGSDGTEGASTDQPAEISEQGAFEATVSGYTIPASTFEMLQEPDEAEVRFDAQILDSDCIRGDLEVIMKDVQLTRVPRPISELTLTGPFTATRRKGACAGSGGDERDAGSSDVANGDV